VAIFDKNDTDQGKDIEVEQTSRNIAHRRGRLFQAYVFASLVGFILLAFFANRIAYFPIDLWITHAIQTFHPAWFITFMVVVSWPGYLPQAFAIVLLFALLLYLGGFRWATITSCGAAIGEAALNAAIKLIIHRPRPLASLVHVMQILNSYSFPSGHVMFYTVFFGFLIFIIYTRLRATPFRNLLLILFGSLVGLVGVSRIYLGEHWASDVLGGYLLGSLCLLVAIRIYSWVISRNLTRQPSHQEKR
jgi:membrane-associated phospholipid phosphatase